MPPGAARWSWRRAARALHAEDAMESLTLNALHLHLPHNEGCGAHCVRPRLRA